MYHVELPQVTKVEHRTCQFHQKHPGRSFPGCTCSTSVSSRNKTFKEMTPDEIAAYTAALRGEKPDGSLLF